MQTTSIFETNVGQGRGEQGKFSLSNLLLPRAGPLAWTTPIIEVNLQFDLDNTTVKLLRLCPDATVAVRLFSVVLCFFTCLAFPPPFSLTCSFPFVFVCWHGSGVCSS